MALPPPETNMLSASSDSGVAQRKLLPSTYCPFCMDSHSLPVIQTHATVDAFALSNLLPSGTITVVVHDGGSHCPRTSNVRDWHSLPARNLSTHPADTLFRQLAFLTEHLFLRATCRLGSSGSVIFIRIYLIPNDLPNVHGQLHRRAETVVREARRHMHNVVPLIERNHHLWDADETFLHVPQNPFLPNKMDNRTMAEIYSDLPSPEMSPPTGETTTLYHDVASGEVIWGLRTALYGYQRHSVAVMLHKELSTNPIPDPTYIAVSCMSGARCFIQPSTMTVLRDCPMFSPSQSGILCEELGSGKTVMIIALVLANATQIADPEESQVDERPVMTPLAYHHFPTREHALARDRAGLGQKAIQQVPSLVEILVHYFSLFKAAPARPNFLDELEASHLWPLIQANRPFYHHYDTDHAAEVLKRSRRRLVPNLSPRTMYLSSATLVIVPLTLLGQWKTEIDKHCHDCVRYLIVRPSMALPDARKLASDYELIVMSDTRFRKESKKNKIDKLFVLKSCVCKCLEGTRIPDCNCPGNPEVTPLLQVRWKRLVIDEGHTTGNVAATINHFVRQLSIQHKWIVTGTPTSNILGLQLGRTADEQHEPNQFVDPAESPIDSGSPTAISPTQDDERQLRIWGNYDNLNLRKLGVMIGDFVGVPQFRTNSKSFNLHVSAPLCNQSGPQSGAIRVLSQVMQMVMVRHRVEDVEKDVLLPPMEHQVIYLDLNDYALKSYNAMQASVVINAIDSEREGPDYLFHPSSAKALHNAISNSSQGLFWSAADDLYSVDQTCTGASRYLSTASRRNVDPGDMDLLREAINHATAAADDKAWRAMQFYPDVPFVVSGLQRDIFEAWARNNDTGQTMKFMHPDRLTKLRSLVRKNPLISRDDLIREGIDVERKERKNIESRTRGSHEVRKAKQRENMEKEVRGTIEVLKKHVERMNVSEVEDLEEYRDTVWMNQSDVSTGTARVSEPSCLQGVKVGPSLSTKLNYVLSEVQQYSAEDKFLIFSNSVLTLSQIAEALLLFEVKYLAYTNDANYLIREQCITTFETSDVYRVLLMELKLGARGLNLISASRVIFCEPVWHPDVESQAIKRVHRIGQTRPVTVKTLAIRSTAEEAMVARREYLRISDKIPTSMVAESGMRHYLQYPRFLHGSASDDSISVTLSLDDNQVAVGNMESNLFQEGCTAASRIDVELDNPASGWSLEGRVWDAMAHKHKRVRFE